MCIIVYKPAGKALPDESILRECWSSNRDGAGFMFPADGLVRVRKGYMTFDSFLKGLKDEGPKDWTDTPLVMHFRITTHGGTNPEMTHPFPVTAEEKCLKSKRSAARVAIAHNGIMGKYGNTDISDTAHFVRAFATPRIGGRTKWHLDKGLHKAMADESAGSRLAIMSADGTVVLTGHFEKSKGISYSNGSYKPVKWEREPWTPRVGGGWSAPSRTVYGRGMGVARDDERLFTMPFTPVTHRVEAAFLPVGAYVTDTSNGLVFSGDDDLYMYDRTGKVYLLDGEADAMVLIPDYEALDGDTLEPLKADKSRCLMVKCVEVD